MSQTQHKYVVSVMAADRPGIVAAVSQAVLELDGNIVSASQTVLDGYFTLIVIVSFGRSIDAAALAEVVRASGRSNDFQVCVRPYERPAESLTRAPGTETFIITLIGADRKGIIHRFTRYLAERGINIVDFYGYLEAGQFVNVCQVDIPPQYEIAQLQADLEHLGRELEFTVRLQHEDVFIATNELRLSREGHSRPVRAPVP